MLLKPLRRVVDCFSWIHAILCFTSISLAKLPYRLWSREEVFCSEISMCSQLEGTEENIFSSWLKRNVLDLWTVAPLFILTWYVSKCSVLFFFFFKLSCFSKLFQSTLEIYVNGFSKVLMLMKITHSAKFGILLKYQSMGSESKFVFIL